MVPAELPDGTGAVLKVNPPGEVECEHEPDALQHYDGRGAVRLLDREDRILLLERCRPGTWLWELPEDEANAVAAGVLRQLWRPPAAGHPFRKLEDEAARWVSQLERAPAEPVVTAAIGFLRELGPTQGEQVVLHQDLQGSNVLASERGWLAVDPKPLVGEREFDLASMIRDRRFAFDGRLPKRRVDFYSAELGLDRERVWGWAVAHAVAWNGSDAMLASARALL